MFGIKATFPVKKSFWSLFFRFIEHGKCKGAITKGPQGILTFFGQLIRRQKVLSFRWRKDFGLFFLVSSSLKTSRTCYKGPQANLKITVEPIRAFLGSKRPLKTENFGEKKGNFSGDEKILAYFSSYYCTWHMSGNKLSGSPRYFDNLCANDKITSLDPKRAIETNISKKSCFNNDKSRWPVSPRIIDCDNYQRTICRGPQVVLTFFVELIRSFF